MKVFVVVVACFIILTLSSLAQGFLQEFTSTHQPIKDRNPYQKKNDIRSQHTEALMGQELEVRLQIGQTDSPQISIQQLLLHLDETDRRPPRHTALGSTGAITASTIGSRSSKTTTGCHTLTIAKPGSFINHSGRQEIRIDPTTAVWELLWEKPDSPAGTLVLSLDIEQDAIRNDAKLKKGHLDISFVLWTEEGIQEYQHRKAICEEAASVHRLERDEQFQKYLESTNLLAKLVHYRNAAAAMERYSLYPVRSLSKIPDNDDLIPLYHQHGLLFLTRTGTIWRTRPSGSAMSSGSSGLEGSASIKVPAPTTNNRVVTTIM